MKKLLIYFSLLILNSAFCKAQDTLVLRNGQKMGVKVILVDNRITYSIPPADKQISISISKIRRIKYGDGTAFTNGDSTDADKVKFCNPYIIFSGGSSIPIGNNGEHSYYNLDDETGDYSYYYSGYEDNGSIFSVTGGMNFYKGWSLTGMFSYVRNKFDASGFMTEKAGFFIDTSNLTTTNLAAFLPITSVSAIGTYYSSNYSCLLGMSRDWQYKYGSIGFSVMVGPLIHETPALHGVATYEPAHSNTISYYYLNLNAETQSSFDFVIGLHGDINITHHIFIRGLVEIHISDITSIGGAYQVVNMTTGNTFYSGSFANASYAPTLLSEAMLNVTAGVGYKF